MIAFADSLLALLPTIVEEYIDAHELCHKQQRRLRLHVRCFCEWRAGAKPAGSDTAVLSAWLAGLAEVRAPATVNGYRQSVLGLVKFATPDGEPLPRTDRVRRQREPEKINLAFTHDEIR